MVCKITEYRIQGQYQKQLHFNENIVQEINKNIFHHRDGRDTWHLPVNHQLNRIDWKLQIE